ncbi:MAG: hypothetical protein AUJ98_07185 [Bacteroidetes bacterium CG2_30_33_31]|nr:MAG: hypothetical protein AUJ98_07185 [Bacteroidetes bacterium CG2_30_33_31]
MKAYYYLISFMLFYSFGSCSNADTLYLNAIKAWQDTLNSEFQDSIESPLSKKDLALFKELDFYKIDKKFCVTASFVRTPEELPFGMKTTTDRLPVYVKYGEAYFNIDGKTFKLNVYQNQELIKKEGYKDYLFIPFVDKTSGKESYKGGRYVDLRISKNESLIIDFNKAYNPYCAYNHRFSCPIPPYENTLDIEINAGVKKFH